MTLTERLSMSELWQQFFFHLRAKRRSKATLTYYGCTQRIFGRFLVSAGLPQEARALTTAHLRAFMRSLEAGGLAPGGVHGHARAIRALFNWAHREELLAANPVQRLELPTLARVRLPTVNVELTKRLLAVSKTQGQPLRDAAMILTLFDTGVRVQELASLRTEDLLFERGLVRVMGKGHKERFVPIGGRAMQAVSAYLRRERAAAHAGVQHVFLGRGGLGLTKSGVTLRLLRLGECLELPRSACSPHTFRRGFAVEFLRNGGDVFTLQQIMGHANLEMTRRYVTFLDDDLKAAHLRFSPADRL
ncbi:tyrosine-type recombinase/integrase [Deinococcus sp.]|uniref:tyrosine-type recombinase/integrase n=1 Tax=Deinococcus sp. TaxID=47478 RepID=UPI003B5B3C9F